MCYRKIVSSLSIVGLLLAGGITARAEGPTISGFVDVGYNYNLNGLKNNTLRSFDANANALTLQNAEMVLEGKLESGVSYRADVDYGYDASCIHSAGFVSGGANAQVDLQQAYMSIPLSKVGGSLTVGKFVTLHGAEVIEAKDNFNISRGFLFNYAIPFTHTGMKWDRGWGDRLTTTVGLVNGWDNMQDNNKGKTLHAMASYAPCPKTALTLGGTYGPEQTSPDPVAGSSTEKNSRGLVDTILKLVPSDKLTLLVNHDWGVEEGLAPAGTDTTQNWQGLGVHAQYLLTKSFAVGLRWETLDDEGSRTGAEQVLHSATGTAQYKIDGVTYRLEYRRDMSTQKVFLDSAGLPKDTQDTIGLQMIVGF
ncbi:MAG TPA: outer membrane beta-barrel protein [Elusimicrobiota bacterium]|nr:outer membrane beta-barrel protein [Elusimicrobiota bacterium]